MEIISSIAEMQGYSKEMKLTGHRIGFVPTMGYLHNGHISLINLARKKSSIVVMSIFVNPTQFGPNEDYNQYPRDFERDKKLAEDAKVDVIFYPDVKEMYPDGYKTYINVEGITDNKLCGKFRKGHFRGVATIVTKLFNIVQPDVAVFGQKDAQQFIVIKRMVKDLNMDIEIVVGDIIREEDGLAMSSRNVYLSPDERKQALCLYHSLQKAKELIDNGEKKSSVIISQMRKLIKKESKSKIDYISIVDIENLDDIDTIKETPKSSLIALAVRIGKTRLIDNMIV